jgi:hypothetical protein
VSTPEGLAPALILGQSLVLPAYGRPDLAYTDSVSLQTGLGAGQTWLYTVPGDQFEVPQAVHVWLQTSATVANRGMAINFQDVAGLSYMRTPVNAVQTASNLVAYSFNLGAAQSFVTNNRGVAPLPLFVLSPTDNIGTAITNLQAGDKITELVYTRQIIPTGPPLVHLITEPAETPVLS